jgi:hypothetical protein
MVIPSNSDERLERSKRTVVQRDGYAVEFFIPYAIRYCEGDRSLTVWAEMHVEHRKWTFYLPEFLRTLLMKAWWEIDIDDPLTWDGSTERPTISDVEILERIEAAAEQQHLKYVIKRFPSSACLHSAGDEKASELV